MKWIKILLGSLLGLVVLAAAFVAVVSQVRWVRDYENFEIHIAPITIPTGPAAVERGQHLVNTHYCGFCHAGNLSGGYLVNDPALAIIPAPNLTSGAGGIGTDYSDEDWVRAIRYGVGRDGRALLGMPSSIWYNLSDEDLGALIAYLKTLSPIDNELPARVVGPMGRVLLVLGQFPRTAVALIDHEAIPPAAIEPAISIDYGRYLVLSACSACHGQTLNGGTIRGLEGDLEIAPNLTPGGEFAAWSEAEFVTALRTGIKPGGRTLSASMPWYYVGQMNDKELKAVWLYLQSLPAMEQNMARTDW
jgi:mono/diheme cytochrome c family protein